MTAAFGFGPSVRWALAVMAVLMVISTSPASAGVGWCRSDPLIMVDGVIADIFVSAPLDELLKVTGPTQIVVATPVEVDAFLILSTLGFGYGEIVSFEKSRRLKVRDGGIELQIQVFVPATDDQMPLLVEFAPRILGILAPVAMQGTANDWISYRVVL
jgi:hypothetical protein